MSKKNTQTDNKYNNKNMFETEHSKPQEPPPFYYLIIGSSVVCWALLYGVSGVFLPESIKKSRPPHVVKDLKSRVVSSIHALYAFAIAIYFFTTDWRFADWDLMHGSDEFSIAFATVVGYFVYDFILICTDWKHLGGYGMAAHHIMAIFSFIICMYYKTSQVLLLLFALTEITTPIVNNRIFLMEFGKKESISYAINGLLMWVGFVLFRLSLVFVIPYILHRQWNDFSVKIVPILRIVIASFYVGISFLNTFWTWKITIGLIKVISGGSPAVQKKKSQ